MNKAKANDSVGFILKQMLRSVSSLHNQHCIIEIHDKQLFVYLSYSRTFFSIEIFSGLREEFENFPSALEWRAIVTQCL